MKKGIAFFFILISFSNPLIAQEPLAMPTPKRTLLDCYKLALQRNEIVRLQTQKIVQAEERQKEALGTVLPKIQFNFSQLYQDTSGIESGSGGVGATFTRSERPEAKFALRQELFSGFKEFAALSAAKSLSQKETFLLKNTAKILFRDIALSFYQIVQLQKDLSNTQTVLHLTQERITELEERVKLGKSRPSELLSVESQLAALKSEEENILGNLAIAQENLSYLTGLDAESFTILDEPSNPEKMEPLEYYLNRMGQRTDVQAQNEAVKIKRQETKIARSRFFPQATLAGNYYTKRVGFQEAIDWDVLLNLEVPLFQGGIALAGMRRSVSELKEAELELTRLKRIVQHEIRKKYLLLRTSLQQSKTMEEATQKSEESYRIQAKEYRLGLVNNLEVLQALNHLQATKKEWDRILTQSKLQILDLQIAVEEMPQ